MSEQEEQNKPIKELYITKEHPYAHHNSALSISANPEYTSPILNLIDYSNQKFDTTTGKSLGETMHCIYYDSKNGKFIKKHFNRKSIVSLDKEFIKDNTSLKPVKINNTSTKNTIIKYIQENLLHKKVSLTSVNLELNKKKVNRSSSDGEAKETNHLEFLPPIMHIIGYKFTDEKSIFCENTGNLKLELKCKWYNSISKTYSEEFIPYNVLVLIPEKQGGIELNKLIIRKRKSAIKLANDKEIKYDIIEPKNLYFYHYYTRVNCFNFVSQKENQLDYVYNYERHDKITIFPKSYPDYNYNSTDKKLEKVEDYEFQKEKFYYITYRNRNNEISNRIIYIQEISSESNNKILISYCLLRKGELRLFRKEGILSFKEVDSKILLEGKPAENTTQTQ